MARNMGCYKYFTRLSSGQHSYNIDLIMILKVWKTQRSKSITYNCLRNGLSSCVITIDRIALCQVQTTLVLQNNKRVVCFWMYMHQKTPKLVMACWQSRISVTRRWLLCTTCLSSILLSLVALDVTGNGVLSWRRFYSGSASPPILLNNYNTELLLVL